jgi:hypothetical protein
LGIKFSWKFNRFLWNEQHPNVGNWAARSSFCLEKFLLRNRERIPVLSLVLSFKMLCCSIIPPYV